MQVRVFESPDMASGLKLVRKELGADALILSTRTVRNGKLGFLGKPTIKITAAIDSRWPEETTSLPSSKAQEDNSYSVSKTKTPPAQNIARATVSSTRFQTTVGSDPKEELPVDYSEKTLLTGNTEKPYNLEDSQGKQRAPNFVPADDDTDIHEAPLSHITNDQCVPEDLLQITRLGCRVNTVASSRTFQ